MTEKMTPLSRADDLRKLRRTLVFVTIIPLLAFSAFILYYLPSEVLKTVWVAAILAAVMLLMLAGIQMMFRLITAVAQTARRDEAAVSSLQLDLTRDQPALGGRSIRHTVAEAAALIGAIPLLALGYVVVRYVLWVKTIESVLLIACFVSAVIVLGISRIYSLTRRIISAAAAARNVRMETRAPERDLGRDEIGTLSADLAHIALSLSTRASELCRARNLVERLPHPMLVVDAAGKILLANKAALILLRCEEREIVGTAAWLLFWRAEEPGWILGEKGDAARENIWRCKDGTLVPVSVRIGALSADGGGGSVLIATDIGERKSSEEALRESKENHCVLFEGSHDALMTLEPPSWAFTSCNRSTVVMFRAKSAEEFVSCGFWELSPERQPDGRASAEKAGEMIEKAMREGSHFFEWTHKRIGGEEFPATVLLTRVENAGKRFLQATVSDISELKQAERDLRQGHESFLLMCRATHDALWDWDLRTGALWWNENFQTSFGYPPEEIESGIESWTNRIHPDDGGRVTTGIHTAIDGGKTLWFDQYRFRRKDGSYAEIYDRGYVLRDANGEPVRMIGSMQDITELKRSDAQRDKTLLQEQRVNVLQQSLLTAAPIEDKLRTVTDGIVRIFDVDFCRIWLIRPGDLCGRDCVHAGVKTGTHACRYRNRCLHLLASSGRYTHTDGKNHRRVPFGCYKIGRIASGEDHKFLANDVQNDPRIHNREWARELGLVSFAGYQLRAHGGDTLGVLAFFAKHPIPPTEDALLDGLSSSVALVIQQSLSEEKLQQSDERLRFALEASHVGAWDLDLLDHTAFRSPEHDHIFGYAELLPQWTYELFLQHVLPEDRAEVETAFHQAMVTQSDWSFECRIRRVDGEVRWIWATGRHRVDESGGRRRMVGIVLDVTERKQETEKMLEMERRLLHAQKLESLGVLAGGIAHDFNNLLTAILGNLDLALYDLSPVSPARTSVEEAIHATRRAEALTRQMLAYSGKGKFIITDLDLSELVEENAHLLKTALSKSTTLSLDLGRELPVISTDAGQIQQVVMNLVINASESLGEQSGIVALSTGVMDCDEAYLSRSRLEEKPAPGQFVFLEVTDTGSGMDEETKDRLFDPFFTTKFTGRGLGMSAVLGIVRGHKGAIMVESEVGKGTTIRMLLPVSKAPPVERGPNEKIAKGRIRDAGKPPLSGTVLVVDDEEMVRAPCAAMVEHAGYRALTAASGDEAVALFRDHQEEIICVILDLAMPGKDGVATFEALRKINPDVQVILSSGYNEQEATQRFSGQGLAGFIKKPYEMETLLAELERVAAM